MTVLSMSATDSSGGGAEPGRIPVTVTSTEFPLCDPLHLYESIAAGRPDGDVYLFESLSGPEWDCRSTMIGWGRLAELRVFADRVELDAPGPLGAELTGVIDAALGEGRTGVWPLRDKAQTWQVLRALQHAFAVTTEVPQTEFAFGFLSTFTYESAWDMDELSPNRVDVETPRCALTLFQHTIWYDVPMRAMRRLTATGPHLPAAGGDPVLLEPWTPPAVPAAARPRAVRHTVTEPTFIGWAERCLEHIRAGDIYQIQIGHRIEVETDLTPRQVYQRLRHRNPSPYMYLLPWAGRTVIGASPELFIRIEGDRIVMRPIAGTTPRAADPAEDRRRAQALRASEKEQAEHVMLVDLCRNDISRVCEPGTLAVDAMMDVEPFTYVHHLVSTISARIRAEHDVWSVLCATFPAGTMTGAPKLRAMEIIDEIEGASRGIYAGALGLVDVRGYTSLALCIRTTVLENGVYHTQASAGIVADSVPAAEWRETLAKMNASFWALTGEELLS